MKVIPKVKRTKLKNGLQIVAEEIQSLRSVALGLLVGTGSANESDPQAGLSHLVEHLCFKGTKKRSAYEIAHALDAVGGKLNAYTTKEYTMYYAVVLDRHLEIAADVLSDLLLGSLFEQKALETEKGVILEEIKMYEDTPDELVHDFFAEKILHQHPIGRPTIGWERTVSSFSRQDVLDYHRQWYTPGNTILSIAGALPRKVVDLLKTHLESWSGSSPAPRTSHPEIKGSLNLKRKKTEQVNLCLGFKGVSQTDDDRYPYSLLDNILGGSMSSRLFQEVREKRGLVYSIYSTSAPFRDCGLAYVYAGTSKENLAQVVELVLKEFRSLKKDGLSQAELDRAREHLKGSLVLGMESTSARMSWIARSEFYFGRTLTVDEVFKQVDRVKREEIVELARKYFRDEYLTLAVIGDLEKLPFDSLTCG